MRLIPLDTAGVHARWGWIRNGLLIAQDKTRGRHMPEDVYAMLRAGQAWAYTIDDDGDELGFYVLTKEYDPDGLVLHIWSCWTVPWTGEPHKTALYAALEDLARAAGAKRLRMQSPRKGWEREAFFNKVAVVYEHEVTQ